jgi:hypothetical protein
VIDLILNRIKELEIKSMQAEFNRGTVPYKVAAIFRKYLEDKKII